MSATTLHRDFAADQLRLGVTVEERPRRPTLVAGESGDAITMPAAFGALVQAELEIMMLAGPVVPDMAEGSWTFLTQPSNTPSPAVPADLLALGVRLLPAGTRVVLPATSDRPGQSAGVPVAPSRPPAIWSVVIGASRRVAERECRSGPAPAPVRAPIRSGQVRTSESP